VWLCIFLIIVASILPDIVVQVFENMLDPSFAPAQQAKKEKKLTKKRSFKVSGMFSDKVGEKGYELPGEVVMYDQTHTTTYVEQSIPVFNSSDKKDQNLYTKVTKVTEVVF
jgi:hypothetical protein